MRLNPFYPDQYLWDKAGALTKLQRFDEAIACLQHMNNPGPGSPDPCLLLCALGRLDEARAEAERIRAAQPDFDAETWARESLPDRRPEDIELFIRGLRAAGL